MKKFFKYFLIVPIIFIAFLTLLACGDDKLKSIKLSIPNCELTSGYYTIKLDKNEGENKRVPLKVEINPDSFTAKSLEYTSSNHDVAEDPRCNKNGEVTLTIKNEGQTNITATYKKANNSVVSTMIKILVNDVTSNIYFDNYTYIETYKGEDLAEKYRVVQDPEKKLQYKYYEIDVNNQNNQIEVDEIVDAGRYKITCTNPENPKDYDEAFVIVNKKRLSFVAGDYEACYGDKLPENLYYEGDVPNNVIAFTSPTKILYGIGKDEASAIGRYVEVTTAYRGSGVNLSRPYETSIKMNLFSEYNRNYETDFDVEKGSFRITAKHVIIKGKNQNSTYGDRTKIAFDLYSYDDFVNNENSTNGLTPLDSSVVNYSKDVSLGTIVFKTHTGEEVSVNSTSSLSVLYKQAEGGNFKEYDNYEVFFNNATTGRNLILEGVEGGTLTVTPRGVSILPRSNQYKNYGEEDPTEFSYIIVSGSLVNHDTIQNPIEIVYGVPNTKTQSSGRDVEEIENPLGKGNYLANAGSYYFNVNNELNPNYDIILDPRATQEGDVPIEDKVVFEVKPCPIVIKLKDVEALYKTPTGLTSNGVTLHKIGYYGSADDFKAVIEKLTIDGKDADLSTIEDGDPVPLGRINLNTVGRFYFDVGVEKVENDNFFISYKTTLSNVYFDDANGSNYNITWEQSFVNLTKITITITPNKDAVYTKTYDGVTDDTDLFKNGYRNYYFAKDEFGETINLEDVLENYDGLFTLTKDAEYSKLGSNGEYENVASFRDVGKYKIFIINENNIKFLAGKEYYKLELDDSEIYNYEITPRFVYITPNTDQSKIYGMKDSVIRYTFSNLADSDTDPFIDGALSRQPGENVGDYAINLGTLDFGENYTLILDTSNLAVFTIKPRSVTIMPYSYSYVYGENVASLNYNIEVDNGFDSTILVAPNFTGNFNIVRDKDDPTSVINKDVSSFYPVNLDSSGNILSYSIALGTFSCTTNNYVINFIDTSTLTITKRDVVINITPQQKESLDGVEKDSFTLNSSFYTVSNLANSKISTNLTVTLNTNNRYYCDINEFNLFLSQSNTDVTNNYNIIMGVNVVYRINMAIVYLSVVNVENENVSIYEHTYMGNYFSNIFKLISLTDGYEIDYENSNFSFEYIKGAEALSQVKDVGNYVARINQNAPDFKIVIINNTATSEENRVIEFNKDNINTVVGNSIINFANSGYLNVKKAQIQIKNTPSFARPLMYVDPSEYGNNESELVKLMPRLKERTDANDPVKPNDPIFIGVNNESITLRTYDDTTLNYIGSGYSFSNFRANYTYNIIVNIQAVKQNGLQQVVDNNYESLTITVPLRVEPQQMTVTESSFSTKNLGDISNLTYDGSLKSLVLNLSIEDPSKPNFTISYSYQKLAVVYENSVSGKVYYRKYNAETNNPTGETSLMDCSALPTTINSFEIKEYGGSYYAIVNKTNCFVLQSGGGSGVSPDSAGAYICVATCNAYENYTFSVNGDNGEKGVNSSIQFACMFEIKKSQDVRITEWKEDFYYSTQFDFTRPNTLPWLQEPKEDENGNKEKPYFSVYPSYLKEQVVFTMNGNTGGVSGGYLDVGEYTAILTIDNESYYVQFHQKFKVQKLNVDFVFPALKTYVYIGKDRPVTAFLSNIRVVLRRKDGSVNKSVFYDPNREEIEGIRMANIKLTYIDKETMLELVDKDGKPAPPYQIGNYILRMEYGSQDDNYEGSGEFEYSIERRAFTGSIRVENATLGYEPHYTQEEFYNLIKDKMFTIDRDGDDYDVELYVGNQALEANKMIINKDLDYKAIQSPQELGWLYNLNSEGQHYVTFVVIFHDTTIDPVTRSAILTIKRKVLYRDDFDFTSTVYDSYTYDGFRVYNHISYGKQNKIELHPERPINGIFEDGKNIYRFSTQTEGETKYIVISDNMFNPIFELRYYYEINGTELSSAPIEPADNYRVVYDIKAGANYMGNGIGTTENHFSIKKIGTLYLTLAELPELVYNGKNYIGVISGNNTMLGDKNIKNDLITVKRDNATTGTNVNFSIISNQYRPEYGVYLYIYFTDLNGNIINEAKNVGTYRMNVSFAWVDGFDLWKYANRLSIDNNLFNINELKQAEVDGVKRPWYNISVYKDFNIVKAEGEFTINTWNKVFSANAAPVPDVDANELNFYTSVGNPITITARKGITMTISYFMGGVLETVKTITEGESFNLTLDNMGNDRRYVITVTGGDNYKDSSLVVNVKNTPPPQTP